jgi:hypothetical protein
MNSAKTKAAERASKTASQKSYKLNSNQKEKKKPEYFSDLLYLSKSPFLVIANDWNAQNFIQRLSGNPCLLCDESPNEYDLTFCAGKEVCVLHSSFDDSVHALNLAQIIQSLGAKRVFVITIYVQPVQEAQ